MLNADLTLNGSTIDAANNIGIAPVTIRSSNVTFTGNNITLNQATSGNGDGTASSGLGIVVEAGSSINNVKINLTDSHLNMNGQRGYQRAIAFPTTEAQMGMEVNLLRTDITCLTTASMQNATYSQGIGIGALTNPKVTLTDCDLTGMYYAVNNAGICPTNMKLTIDNSRLSGYGALNLRGSSTIQIVNNSVLTGRNFYPAGSNVFATIVYNAGTINAPSTLLVDNSTIQNVVTNTSAEYMINVQNNSNVAITLQNNTKLFDKPVKDGVNIDFMIKDLGTGSTVTADATTILDGKTGVTLIAQ